LQAALAAELGRDLGPDLLAGSDGNVEVQSTQVDYLRAVGSQPHLVHSWSVSQKAARRTSPV
jgi:hypothetical protein